MRAIEATDSSGPLCRAEGGGKGRVERLGVQQCGRRAGTQDLLPCPGSGTGRSQ